MAVLKHLTTRGRGLLWLTQFKGTVRSGEERKELEAAGYTDLQARKLRVINTPYTIYTV